MGMMGNTGLQGVPGPVGPAGPSVAATFVQGGSGGLFASKAFTLLAQKSVAAGSYVAVATVSSAGSSPESWNGAGTSHISTAVDCQLRSNTDVIGGGAASGSVTQFVSDTNEITMTGGVFVPSGETRNISLWCRDPFESIGRVGASQIMILRIGGFF
jgi:hypothetical protein